VFVVEVTIYKFFKLKPIKRKTKIKISKTDLIHIRKGVKK